MKRYIGIKISNYDRLFILYKSKFNAYQKGYESIDFNYVIRRVYKKCINIVNINYSQ